MEAGFRIGTAADAGQIARLFQLTYASTPIPYRDPEHVRAALADKAALWHVAVDGGEVVGCQCMMLVGWNRSCEFGHGVTHPDYRRAGLGTELIQRCLTSGCGTACDVMVGFPRNSTMTGILRDRIVPTMAPVGHDGAMYEVNGRREYHAVVYALNPNRRFRHVTPEEGWLGERHAIVRTAVRSLGFRGVAGAYPAAIIGGPAHLGQSWQGIRYRLERWGRSGLAEIVGWEGGSASDLAARVEQFLGCHSSVVHTRVAVLADKTDWIDALASSGFEVCAYLPGWYWTPAGRFDCVLMTRAEYAAEGICNGFGDMIDGFRREFVHQLPAIPSSASVFRLTT
jgi:hypothetical protein